MLRKKRIGKAKRFMCDKIQYDSMEEAKEEIHRMKSIGLYSKGNKIERTPHRAYKCSNCGKFHLTKRK